jgi:hypothetical protein
VDPEVNAARLILEALLFTGCIVGLFSIVVARREIQRLADIIIAARRNQAVLTKDLVQAKHDAAGAWLALRRVLIGRLGYDEKGADAALKVWRANGYGSARLGDVDITAAMWGLAPAESSSTDPVASTSQEDAAP